MKALVTLLFIIVCTASWAQVGVDSLIQKNADAGAPQKADEKGDAIKGHAHKKTDSLQHVYRAPLAKVDSVNKNFHQRTDSIQQGVTNRLAVIDSTTNHLQNKIDSLTSLNFPTATYTHKLDSLNQLREKTVAAAEAKVQRVKSQTTDKLKSIKSVTALGTPVQKIF